MLGLGVGTPHGVGFDVGQLPLDPIARITHFVEPHAASGARGMGAVFAALAEHVQRLAKRRHRHGLGAFAPSFGQGEAPTLPPGVCFVRRFAGLNEQDWEVRVESEDTVTATIVAGQVVVTTGTNGAHVRLVVLHRRRL